MSFQTGYVYDDRMSDHCFPGHVTHVEGPLRTRVPHAALGNSGLLEKTVRVPSRVATESKLRLVHTQDHVTEVEGYTSRPELYLETNIKETRPTYSCSATYRAACLSAGSLLSLVDAVSSGKVDNGFAMIRPPGHHADESNSDGFCYFNNVAIATRYARQKYDNIKKVAIVDWDVHHGNGIQDIFYKDPEVLYMSLHRFDRGEFYPGLQRSNYDAVGGEKGQGFNVNIAWNDDIMGDVEYLAAFQEIVLPLLRQFKPDLLLVACGFDAARGDPLGGYDVTPETYGWMTQQLMELTSGKLVLSLEGGYSPEMMGQCVTKIVSALLGSDAVEAPASGDIGKSARETLENVKSAHKEFWKFD